MKNQLLNLSLNGEKSFLSRSTILEDSSLISLQNKIQKSPSICKRGNSLPLKVTPRNFKLIFSMQKEEINSQKIILQKYSSNQQIKNTLMDQLLANNTKIDLSNNQIQQLAVDIASKSIRLFKEQKFLLKIFQQNGIFRDAPYILEEDKYLSQEIKCEHYSKGSIIYQTGDFAMKYYILLKGKLGQYLPTSEEVINSPIKLSHPSNRRRNIFKVNKQDHQQSSQQFDIEQRQLKIKLNNCKMIQLPEISKENNQMPNYKILDMHKYNKSLLPGSSFGETELLTRKRRGNTIMSEEDSYVLSISKEAFDNLIGDQKDQFIQNKLEFFSQFEFFQGVQNSKLMELLDTSKEIKLTQNGKIFEEGDKVDSIYFIKEGEIQIVKKVMEDESEKQRSLLMKKKRKFLEIPIIIITKNGYFGEHEIISKQERRNTEAISISRECELVSVNSFQFMKLISSSNRERMLFNKTKSRDEIFKQRIDQFYFSRESSLNSTSLDSYEHLHKQNNLFSPISSVISNKKFNNDRTFSFENEEDNLIQENIEKRPVQSQFFSPSFRKPQNLRLKFGQSDLMLNRKILGQNNIMTSTKTKNDFFTNFIQYAERQSKQKQEIFQELNKRNHQNQAQDQYSIGSDPIINKEEFIKGFKLMFLRTQRKKFQKSK